MRALLAGVVVLATAPGACDRSMPPAIIPRPVASSTPPPPQPETPRLLSSADIDAKLRAAWQDAGVTPTPPATDAVWLRRAWLDVLGTIPPPEVTRQFLSDHGEDPKKRREGAIEAMLASPLWARHWTAYWDDVWMGRDTRAPDLDRGAFRRWLHDEFARDVPWNAIATALLTATGVNSEGRPQATAMADDGDAPPAAGVDGAVNWTLKYRDTPQDMAGIASRTLLGVQIQCAQCHDHKTEHWTQEDFRSFASAFVRTRLVPIDAGKAMGQTKRVEVADLDRPAPRFGPMGDLQAIANATPKALDGTPLEGAGGVRAALARWMTSANNPWFAGAFVNRMWGHFLGRGFSDPVDDLRPSNPLSVPELYGALAADFAASGFDVKHLVRIIVGSEAYALSAAPRSEATAKADPESKLWGRFHVTPLGPEELMNALVAATGLDAIVEGTGRLDLARIRSQVEARYGFLFDVDEEQDLPDFAGTISQALALLNGSVVATGASLLPGSALAGIVAMPGDDAGRLEALYLRTLSRPPTPEETARWARYIADSEAAPDTSEPPARRRKPSRAGDDAKPPAPGAKKTVAPDPLGGLSSRAGHQRADARARAYEDVLWTLLNASEFALNH